MPLKKAPGIVPAVDMNLGKAAVYVDKLRGLQEEVTGLKVGSDIYDEFGYLIGNKVMEQAGLDLPLILDMQKRGTDVPFMIERQNKMAGEYGFAAYIGSPLGSGSQPGETNKEMGSLNAFVRYCRESEMEPIIVLEMTQPGSTRFAADGACEDLARLSMELGVKYFVAPATRPERIQVYREILGDRGEIVSPGSGPQKTGDVVADAVSAIEHGADHLVIGRGLYGSDDPVGTTKRIFEAVARAHEKR